MSDKRQLVLRKIRNGKVKIYGSWYEPKDLYMKYDGRLDRRWYWFGTYWNEDRFVSLWGSDDYKNGKEEFAKGEEVVDGYFVWMFWNRVEEK